MSVKRVGKSAPWWQLATIVLLSVALTIAVMSGRTIEAVIIGILVVPALVIVGTWLVTSIRERRRR